VTVEEGEKPERTSDGYWLDGESSGTREASKLTVSRISSRSVSNKTCLLVTRTVFYSAFIITEFLGLCLTLDSGQAGTNATASSQKTNQELQENQEQPKRHIFVCFFSYFQKWCRSFHVCAVGLCRRTIGRSDLVSETRRQTVIPLIVSTSSIDAFFTPSASLAVTPYKP